MSSVSSTVDRPRSGGPGRRPSGTLEPVPRPGDPSDQRGGDFVSPVAWSLGVSGLLRFLGRLFAVYWRSLRTSLGLGEPAGTRT